jgi:UDP-N-acetylmuramoyl-tripeptide--D-alanyl-D-alanine ligase
MDMERLTLHDLALATGGTLKCSAGRAIVISGVGIDSRSIGPGDVFWAIRGPRHDGRAFIEEAFRAGAVAVVAEPPVPDAPGPVLLVDNAVDALGRFAGWYRSLLDALVIGVTGSVGKTTTRELLHAALGGEPASVRSRRNFNNRLGVPLTLCDIESSHRFAVIEMGADRVGDIAHLAAIARPEVGVITYLGVAHLETFGSKDAIVRGKGELVEAIPSGGFAVLPGDQEQARPLAHRCRGATLFVGTGVDNTHRVTVREELPGRLRIAVDGTPFEVATNGRHFAVAAGMAVVVARRLGRTDLQIARGFRSFKPVAGRSRVAMTTPWTVIDDTYNANPDSMAAAVNALASWPGTGRRIFVCGDMYGLGEQAEAAHRELGQKAASQNIALVVAIGNFARQVAQGARQAGMEARRLACFATRDEAAAALRDVLRPGDVVWVKASRPLELERLVEELTAARETVLPVRSAA